jgi:hypothetical protein
VHLGSSPPEFIVFPEFAAIQSRFSFAKA